jgi:hypothetical protein
MQSRRGEAATACTGWAPSSPVSPSSRPRRAGSGRRARS